MSHLRLLLGLVLALSNLNLIVAQQVVAYDNYPAGFTGQGYNFGAGGLTTQGSVTYSAMFTDNIILDPIAAGRSVSQLYFSVTNRSSTGVTARPHLRFYADDNGGNAPGTYITGYDFNPLTFGGNTTTAYIYNVPVINPLVVPGNARLWAGWLLDNGGGATATPAVMESMGVTVFSIYAAGSGTDAYYLAPAPGSGTYAGNNPPGSLLNASPSGSFGWRFTVAVPEPTTWALISVSGVISAYAIYRRSRVKEMDVESMAEESA